MPAGRWPGFAKRLRSGFRVSSVPAPRCIKPAALRGSIARKPSPTRAFWLYLLRRAIAHRQSGLCANTLSTTDISVMPGIRARARATRSSTVSLGGWNKIRCFATRSAFRSPKGCFAALDSVFSSERTKCRGCSVILSPKKPDYARNPSCRGQLRMQALDERGVPETEHPMRAGARNVPDWESARIFLEVVRAGSFRRATQRCGQSVNALRGRVKDLEKALGVTLLTRHVDGVRTTVEGQNVLAGIAQMEAASFGLLRAREHTATLSGEVRLAVTEGLGTFWIAPRLVEFQRANPNLLVDVNCAMKSADVLRMEADLAIQITRPT